MLTLQELKTKARSTKRRVGRGNASGRGSYSGRGIKGQRARSGGRGGLKLQGLKATFRSLPKVQGFKSFAEERPVLNLTAVAQRAKANIVHVDRYKVLGQGEVNEALTVYAAAFSATAKSKIEAKGGKAIRCSNS